MLRFFLQLLEACDYLGIAICIKKKPVQLIAELIMTGFLLTYILHLLLFLPARTAITSATPLHTPNPALGP